METSFSYSLDKVNKEIKDRTSDTLKILKDKAYSNCPVRTGRMRSSIDILNDSKEVTVNTEYAPYTEYRTGWFSESVEDSKSQINKEWR